MFGNEFPVGGIPVMLVGIALTGLLCLGLQRGLRSRGRVLAWSVALLVWSLAVIGFVTLLPTSPDTGVVYAEDRLGTCSWDYGGPAPDGFWIFSGGQRLLNAAIFVPAGLLWAVATARWRAGRWLVPLGLVVLTGYSVLIEWLQLEVASLNRACDVTDVVDNAAGAALGLAAGVLVALVLRPWRERPGSAEGPAAH
ncbi:VanZ family protein [Nocardioides bruguierae]|uniref:VanZ family protein n=1 Tax=Nocardioides bruguierae TaxID=2945102 RepID=A0A9X2D6M8_9ACTN|nr:VanZ family protein [Nocardioides bruguierae]MCL8024043.1 VanZ family protein [Nocardioides bruguierae]MCM0620291.1 VanZ family protein [Nocardioides bruguierae]